MRLLSKTGAVLALGALVLTGCGQTAQRTEKPEAAGGGAASPGTGLSITTPAARGELDKVTWDIPYGEPSTLDWVRSYAYQENTVLANVCESLLRLTPDFTVEPGLAEFANPTPTTWTYTLRPGLRFAGGNPVTADDVVFSLKRAADPRQSYYTSFTGNIAGIDKSGDDQVTIRLKHPDYAFNAMLATAMGVVAEKAYVEAKGKEYGTPGGGVSCVGPYRLASWESGRRITLERVDDYYDAAHRPKVKQVVFTFVSDPSAIVNSLLSGELDGTYQVPVQGLDKLRAGGSGTLYSGPGGEVQSIYVTGRQSPMHNPKVRKALQLAIDRAAIARTVFLGSATPTASIVPPSAWGYATDALRTLNIADVSGTPDLETAKRLIAEAGDVSGTIILAAATDDGQSGQIAAEVQSAGRKLGLDIQIKPQTTNQIVPLYFDPKAREQVSMWFAQTYLDVPDPLNALPRLASTGGGSNYSGYSNPIVDRELKAAVGSRTPTARAEHVAVATKVLTEEMPVIPLARMNNHLFMNKRLTGAPASFCYLYYPWARDLGAA
ncbi:ABC transporter substrate-binding protein [Streptosporangium sp. NPDC051022]|uniref:ABC transporter substrate-binding protein n=1 Tax=Streptosporangium sp. NPDC051022 TaxID=3155752 RepID=UPI00343454BC